MLAIPTDELLEARAAEVLATTGLTPELAVRALFAYLAEHRRLPDALKAPNAATRLAFVEAELLLRRAADDDRY